MSAIKANIWEGLVRRYQEDRFGNEQKQPYTLMPKSEDSTPPSFTPEQRLQKDMEKLHQKTAAHLQLPIKKERFIVGKLKIFFAFLLFMLAGFFFFIGGFLTCYTLFPPHIPVNKTAWRLQGERETPNTLRGLEKDPIKQDSTPSYAQRQSLLKGNNPADQLLSQAQQDLQRQARENSLHLANEKVGRFTHKIQENLGRYVGGIVAPVVRHIGESALSLTLKPSYDAHTSQSPQKSINPSQGAFMKHNPAYGNAGLNQEAVAHEAQINTDQLRRHFTLQVQNFTSKEDASNLVSALKERGFGAYLITQQTSSALEFSVRTGQFATYQEAQQGSKLLNREMGLSVRVIMLEGEQ